MENKKNPEVHGLQHALLIGILFYPAFYILDIIIYPDFKYDLLIIRLIVTGIFIILYYFTIIIHSTIFKPVIENSLLKDFLPICSK